MWANMSKCLNGFATEMDNNVITNDSPLTERFDNHKDQEFGKLWLGCQIQPLFIFINKVLLEYNHTHLSVLI